MRDAGCRTWRCEAQTERLFDLMHDGRFVLVDDGSVGALAAPWSDRLHTWYGTAVAGPRFCGPLLIRPDGYLAGSGREEVMAGLKRWCGKVPARSLLTVS